MALQKKWVERVYYSGFERIAQTPLEKRKACPQSKLGLANANLDMFPIDLNTATYFEFVQIPCVGPLTAKKILAARKNFKINRSTDLERVIDAKLARRIRRYVDLRDKKLTDF